MKNKPQIELEVQVKNLYKINYNLITIKHSLI